MRARFFLWFVLLAGFLGAIAFDVLATRRRVTGTKFCGCDTAAPCSDCCSVQDCRCPKPKNPTGRKP